MKITITPIQPDEVDLLRELALTVFYAAFRDMNTAENIASYTSKAYSREQLLCELQDERSEHYFLKDGDKPIGFLKLNLPGIQSDINDPNSLEIQRIYIDMAYQNKGLGAVLLEKAIERSKALDMAYVWLGVWEHNPGAIRFYERHGFEKFGTHHFVMGEEEQTDVLMKRML